MKEPRYRVGDIVKSIAAPHKIPRKIIAVDTEYMGTYGRIGYYYYDEILNDRLEGTGRFGGFPRATSEASLVTWINRHR